MNSVNLLSTIVALGILTLIAAIAVVAIHKYTADDALKVLGVLSGLFGVVTGTFVTYFFTREATVIAQQRTVVAEARAKTAELNLAILQSNATDLLATFNTLSDQTSVATLRQDPGFVKSLGYMGNPAYGYMPDYDPAVLKKVFKNMEKEWLRKMKSRRKKKSLPVDTGLAPEEKKEPPAQPK